MSSLQHLLDQLRLRLSAHDALGLMALLAVLCGLATGGVILGFRWVVESSQTGLLGGPEQFWALPAHWRVLLPVIGGALIGLMLQWLRPEHRGTGVVHVMERLGYHQGYMSWRNAAAQFVGASTALISGHSVGREGPAIHLGAASGSLLGQRLGLPNNSLRTLVACGVAGAIGATFNTPLAGVIFAMEVVMLEYTLSGFLPVMLSAVTATVVTQLVYGNTPAFSVPAVHLESLGELGWLLVCGLLIGTLAAAFIQSLMFFSNSLTRWPLAARTTLAGLAVGLIGLALPEVMGVGYETVNLILLGEVATITLVALVAAKLLASTLAVGLGIPGGLIGPTVVIGAAAGGLLGQAAQALFPEMASEPSLYVMLGLGAMMGATLRAPLAALTAMLELTANPNIILPGMLTIATAVLCSGELFGKDSVYLHQLRRRGLDFRSDPLLQKLSRLGIVRIMDRRLTTLPRQVSRTALEAALDQQPRWILLLGETPDKAPLALVPVADVLHHLQTDPQSEVDLLAIPAKRLEPASIEYRASLREALALFQEREAEALCVVKTVAPGIQHHLGVVTRQELEYQYLH
ncbi:chloride channel protein [Alkalilimnicola ehrlichii MLHE-1]|uniref:Cl-channel, voltage-gated family protein n=1 Tax=Alkalilimnicola ehrlichii (strain ATCC BAA-1101 / DSM 17681 / MLHE-1) TaxID=187272 RepID=Q0ABK0_ALKEH|nr:chloride channel protein [Alkalilimnicola ehrlichii]ABI55787.1 Cl- channel, voltage-gated family protein [Alkalilimnicola ehrlichii MLHE-1]